MVDCSDKLLPPGWAQHPSISASLHIAPDRIFCTAWARAPESTLPRLLWSLGVDRPAGRTLAEAGEAGWYRVASAASSGLLVPAGWDRLG